MMADRFQLCADVTESTETWALNDDHGWVCKEANQFAKGFQKEQKLISLFVDDYQVRTNKFGCSEQRYREEGLTAKFTSISYQFIVGVQ